MATALCSALSLDFFLTQPYMRLSIADKHDVIAFVGLTVCGLIAAAVGSQRGERVAALRASSEQLGLVHSGLEQIEKGVPGISASSGCSTPPAACSRSPPPSSAIPGGTSWRPPNGLTACRCPPEPRPGRAGGAPGPERSRQPLPQEGARVALVAGGRQVGWLDVWGTGRSASPQARRTLSGVARLLAVILARAESAPAGEARQP